MAGIKQFDEGIVLEKAMIVFWRFGYEATSLDDIVKATGIKRGSLYNAFGNKEQLFLRVLDCYAEKFGAEVRTALKNPDPYSAMEAMFEAHINRISDPNNPRGCLGVGACMEAASNNSAIASKISQQWSSLETAIYEMFLQAQVQETIKPGCDIRAMARFFVGVTRGMAVMHKASGDANVARDMAKIALKVLE